MGDESESSKSIYDMRLGEYIALEHLRVYRVPGGWLMGPHCRQGELNFVPYSDDFNPAAKSE